MKSFFFFDRDEVAETRGRIARERGGRSQVRIYGARERVRERKRERKRER